MQWVAERVFDAYSRWLLLKHAVDGAFERREVALDNFKNAVDVDPEVLVGNGIPQPGDVGPGECL